MEQILETKFSKPNVKKNKFGFGSRKWCPANGCGKTVYFTNEDPVTGLFEGMPVYRCKVCNEVFTKEELLTLNNCKSLRKTNKDPYRYANMVSNREKIDFMGWALQQKGFLYWINKYDEEKSK